jgi:hypothetical protein
VLCTRYLQVVADISDIEFDAQLVNELFFIFFDVVLQEVTCFILFQFACEVDNEVKGFQAFWSA